MRTIRELPNRLRSALVGAFILLAYAMLLGSLTELAFVVMVVDVVSGLAVIGIAVLMYPLFRGPNPVLPVSYLILKWAEGLLMIAAGIVFLTPSNQGLRDSIYAGPQFYAFIVSGGVFYILMFARKLIPSYISIWGMVSIGLLAVSAIFDLVAIELAFLEYAAVLIILNEVYLAIWLFVRGLRVPSTNDGRLEQPVR
jgi:hypothetical protein